MSMVPATESLDWRRGCRIALGTVVVLLMAARLAPAAGSPTGEQIYRDRCASCHGAEGEGTLQEYPRPLVGDRTAAQLTRLIARTMPADDPGSCTGEEAEKVSRYVFDTFYSQAAQARNAPPRIELARLTVRQYRHAIFDLIGGFREPARPDERQGLRGEYFKARQFRNNSRVLDRIDPEVKFDFGVAGPGPEPEKFDPNVFSIRWEGSVLAPETGEYEFIVRTEHAARLWVNDVRKPLIDAWVKSGNDTEYRAPIVLLGGRSYPIRLEFSKAKQGVDDSKKQKKRKPPEIKASIALEWKPPKRVAEVIPARYLSPGRSPEALVVTAAFPPDDRSAGYERGTSISKAWDQATTDAAIEVADYVVAHERELAGTRDGDPERPAKLRAFGRRFAERAFRRPLTEEQAEFFVERSFRAVRQPETALNRVVLLVLKSPRFLYRELNGGRDAYDVASRLSFTLWDTLPDEPLLKAAASGQLTTRDQVTAQAERMAADPRTRAKVREFFLRWLKVDAGPDLSKDKALFPGFDEAVISDLRSSLDLFVEDVVWGDASDFRRLLLADSIYLNGRLARFYGADLPPDAPFRKVAFEPDARAGVLTHPYLLASFAYTASSSPIHRGVFLARSVLGRSLRPPPEAFAPLPADLHPNLSTRERVALQTRPEACMSCHAMINPLGFTLESFDAVGRYRKEEKGRPVDATGLYQTRSGETVTFAGARDLAEFLADSEEVHAAFVDQLFHDLVKQPIRAFGPTRRLDLQRFFADHEFRIRTLVVEIAASSALAGVEPGPRARPDTAAAPDPRIPWFPLLRTGTRFARCIWSR